MAWASVQLEGYYKLTAVNTNRVVAILDTGEGCKLLVAGGGALEASESASEVGRRFIDAEASQPIPVKVEGP